MRMLLGKFRILDIKMDYQHDIPVWLEVRKWADTYVIRAFFTDYYKCLREIGLLISSLPVFPVEMFDHQRRYYNKWIITEVCTPDWDKLEEDLKDLWSFKAKSKYFKAEFVPSFSSPKDVVNGLRLELGV